MRFSDPLLIALTLFIPCVSSQAPGDESSICIESHIYEHSYPDNVRVLMDSWNYEQLLPGQDDIPNANAVWTDISFDGYDDDTSGIASPFWQHRYGGICRYTAYVCGYSTGGQNNWLFTQHISKDIDADQSTYPVNVFINITYSFRGCEVEDNCHHQFRVYYYITNSVTPTADHQVTSKYTEVSTITSTLDLSLTETISFQLQAEQTGFYLAIQDFAPGTCVSISRLLVYRLNCRPFQSDLVLYPDTPAPHDGSISVDVTCANHSTVLGSAEATCLSSGRWGPETPECQCSPGYGLDNTNGMKCDRLPSAPLNVSISHVTNTSAVLSWLPPEDDGGRGRSEIYYTVTATGTGASVSVEVTVNVTMAEVTGLTPFTDYTFSVTSENAVSSQATDTGGRTATATATTLEGVAGSVTDVSQPTGGSSVLSWSPPSPPNGIILHYTVRITPIGSGELVVMIIEVFNDTNIDISKYVTSDGKFIVEVQAVTIVGHGNFSIPVTVSVGEDKESNNSVVIGVAVAIVVVIILLAILAGLLLTYAVWLRRTKKGKEDKHVYEVPDITIPAPPPPRVHQHHVRPPPRVRQEDVHPPPRVLQQNVAYGAQHHGHLRMTINAAYST